ncbi:MAG: C40 family peptidase [Nitrospirae bacterium]|nr:C40 family peptidase [Nitrospirota bacterium]
MRHFRVKGYSFIQRFLNYSGIGIAVFSLFLANASFAESYKIKKGDTLYSISKEYKIPADEIKKINGLKKDYLKSGSTIILPSKKEDSDSLGIYIVKKGDTLYEIAKDNNTTAKELKRLNSLKKNALGIGQKLLLPAKKDAEAEILSTEVIEINSKHEAAESEISPSETGSEISDTILEYLDTKQRLILFAKKFLDTPYRFGGSSILGIDCSAFVQKVFDLFSIPLPRTAREQFYLGNKVDKVDLTIGDLVFFKTYASFPSHVGIYIGDNLFIHASSKDKKVKINNLDEPYYFKRFLGAKRLFEEYETTSEKDEDKSR